MRRVLFPDGEPALGDSLQERYDRMDLPWAIGVLMGNRDLTRRLAAETGVDASGQHGRFRGSAARDASAGRRVVRHTV